MNKANDSDVAVGLNGKLGKNEKAADSNKLGGQISAYYLPATGKASDSAKLNGQAASYYVAASSLNAKSYDPVILSGAKGYTTSSLWFPKYSKSGNVVQISGVMVAWTNSKAIFILPAGFRPARRANYPIFITSNTGANPISAYMEVRENGEVYPTYDTPTAVESDKKWLHLSASFLAVT